MRETHEETVNIRMHDNVYSCLTGQGKIKAFFVVEYCRTFLFSPENILKRLQVHIVSIMKNKNKKAKTNNYLNQEKKKFLER
jgi:hypothetical protein